MPAHSTIGMAGALVVAIALMWTSALPVQAARSGHFGRLPSDPPDDWWNRCPAIPCEDVVVPKAPKLKLPKIAPVPKIDLPEIPKLKTYYVKTYYDGPGSMPSVVPPLPKVALKTRSSDGSEVRPRTSAFSKKRPGVYQSKNGTAYLVRVEKTAAPRTYKKMQAYNKGARRWNHGPQTGFSGGGWKPDPEFGGGMGWKKVKAKPYRSRVAAVVPKAKPRQAMTALASSFATAVNGEHTRVKVGGWVTPAGKDDAKITKRAAKSEAMKKSKRNANAN